MAMSLFALVEGTRLYVITIGIDPHKSSLTAVALDGTGKLLESRRITVNAAAYTTLTDWAARWPQRRFAVEGAAGLGRGIAQLLAAAGENVVDVPATLAARARLLDTGGIRKTDVADAVSVAHAAMRRENLRQVTAENDHTRLRLLSERRDDLARERVRLLNRLHVMLRDLIPGGAPLDLTADKARNAAARHPARHRHRQLPPRPRTRHDRRPAPPRPTPAHQPDADPASPGRDALHDRQHARCRAPDRREGSRSRR
ncbi:transposase [Micromonospora sp. KC723]|uniref:IS110 family transposase n=1 Tax=Micromonospora sp. KC723 TaxID=2530381 RepID=UPI00104AD2F0|nr:transposase [Micromonospora sp. KC723]TDB72828.1 hypothetical protein E1165_19105 [Micromonospora sp. KC723]